MAHTDARRYIKLLSTSKERDYALFISRIKLSMYNSLFYGTDYNIFPVSRHLCDTLLQLFICRDFILSLPEMMHFLRLPCR